MSACPALYGTEEECLRRIEDWREAIVVRDDTGEFEHRQRECHSFDYARWPAWLNVEMSPEDVRPTRDLLQLEVTFGTQTFAPKELCRATYEPGLPRIGRLIACVVRAYGFATDHA